MIRISKLTDYAIVLLTQFARESSTAVLTAKDLAAQTHLPLPTVGKLLKTLSRSELLHSQRGLNGGYRLAKGPADITIAEIISVMEGPIGITECSIGQPCDLTGQCPVQPNWQKINRAIRSALEGLTLEEMSHSSSHKPAAQPMLAQAEYQSPLTRVSAGRSS